MTVDTSGAVFEQSTTTGCVLNGQISIIDSNWNLYAITLDGANCQGIFESLNGATFTGLASLVDDMGTDILVAAVTGDVAGNTESLAAIAFRM